MKKRIIDHKPVLMTDDEYRMYTGICRSYDRPNFRGEDLFIDHFESSDEGFIIFVKPPSKRYSSLEVYCFLVSLMTNQHMRLMHNQVDTFIQDCQKNFVSVVKKLEEKVALLEKKEVKKELPKQPEVEKKDGYGQDKVEEVKKPKGRSSRRRAK